MDKIGFGGSCHWCTEAIFQSLKGVTMVEQGWVSSKDEYADFSEAVIVHFDPELIPLDVLIEIHLFSHSCTGNHTMRKKYRSAVYTFQEEQKLIAQHTIAALQQSFEEPIITKVLPFQSFKQNKQEYLNYYYSNPEKPFCETYINPKLQLLRQYFNSFSKDI